MVKNRKYLELFNLIVALVKQIALLHIGEERNWKIIISMYRDILLQFITNKRNLELLHA